VIDKAVFPRDKVCGDGLSGKVITVLKKIDPDVAQRFLAFTDKQPSWGVDFVAPARHIMHIPYKADYDVRNHEPLGFVCKRIHFDNFLVDELKRTDLIELIEGVNITRYEKTNDGYLLADADGKLTIRCSLMVIANGAQSTFNRQRPVFGADGKQYPEYSVGVRGYYSNVKGLHPDHFIELHFLTEFLPGYLWIFPTGNGTANVGIDMLSEDVAKKNINLRYLLNEMLLNDPVLSARFVNASATGKTKGYTLPLAGNDRPVSADHLMIVGDAAFMIDPLTGEGIGNAMYAARLAALQAAECLEAGDFSAAMMQQYDAAVKRVLGAEFKLSRRLQSLARNRSLFNWLMKKGSRSTRLQHLVSGMLYDVDLRKQLASPRFYISLLFKK
jgi:flavin-dependent dehydrogenase